MENNSLSKIFDLVAATRDKGLIRITYTPLAQDKIVELQGLLKEALDTDTKVQKNVSLREKLLAASGVVDRCKDMPLTVTVPIYRGSGDSEILPLAGYQQVWNAERMDSLAQVQHKLYKAVKPHIK